jgi:hypothetical protein
VVFVLGSSGGVVSVLVFCVLAAGFRLSSRSVSFVVLRLGVERGLDAREGVQLEGLLV